MIPYLCPELPAKQKEALRYLVKTPLIYANVALRDWTAFKALGISSVYAPGSYFSSLSLNAVVDIGDYKSPRAPEEPMLVRMVRTPCQPGLSERDQNRAGQHDIFNTTFETFERNIRDQLARILGPGGFDPASGVTGITVNRWPHGYAYEYNQLFDPEWPEAQQPHVIGRARFGRIAIANSDSGAAAYTDSAIDQAYRAVQELLQTLKLNAAEYDSNAGSVVRARAGLDLADRAAGGASVHAGDPGGEGGARAVGRAGAADVQHRAVRHGLRHAVLRLAVGSLWTAAGAALGAGAVSHRQCGLGGGRFDRPAGARPVLAGHRRRLRRDARPRHRPGRLRQRTSRQGDRVPDDVLHHRPDDLADRRRHPDRHFGWRSVFGFALVLGAAIALGAYVAVFETRPPSPQNRVRGNVLRNYAELFRHLRFTAFVLQSGFMTATFLVTATAASSLLKDMLHRPSTEFGFYFLLFPFGFLAGNFITSRIGNRVANETMVLAGSLLSLAAVTTQSSLLARRLSDAADAVRAGFLHHHGAGPVAVLRPVGRHGDQCKLAGTAAGLGVFVQNFCGAAFAQLYGFIADGTVVPLTETTAVTVLCGLLAGVLPFVMARRARPA